MSTLNLNILVLHGPNLNSLGSRQPDIYGSDTLNDINEHLATIAAKNKISFFQSNHEGALIDKIYEAQKQGVTHIIVNPAGFSHTSVALLDAFLAVDIPFIEVHLSNIYKRESFRHKSYFSPYAVAVVSGMGVKGYEMALRYLI